MSKKVLIHVLSHDMVGGCEAGCINLVQALKGGEYAQEVVFLSEVTSRGPASSRLREMQIPVFSIPIKPSRWAFVRAFARHCHGRRPIVVCHIFGIHFFVGVGARLGGAKTVLALAGNPPPNTLRLRVAATVYAQLGRLFLDHEIGCTQYVVERMQKEYHLPRRRLRKLSYIIPVETIRERAAQSRMRRNVEEEGPVLGMVARLDPIKGHAQVMRAFSILLAMRPRARLRFLGDGSERQRLEQLATDLGIFDRVEFLGTRADVPEQLGLLDIFVYGTTRDEGFGIVLAEAMAADLPIVATDIGPCREVLDGYSASILVSPGNPGELATAVLSLLDRANERVPSRNSRNAVERYSGEKIVPQFAVLLASE